MGSSLTEIAQTLKNSNKTVQLIYAFNGTGKTRLSREFKSLINSSTEDSEEEETEIRNRKILYYNAFTEDLFYWDNDLENNRELKLKIHTNDFTKWILEEQGQENDIYQIFQKYNSQKLIPVFNSEYTEASFTYRESDTTIVPNIKISKGEESNFIWSIFYSMFKAIIEDLNEQKAESQFSKLQYIFIDDPVTSLDNNNIIRLAVDTANLIDSSETDVKFIITTHTPLFYNVLCNELKLKTGSRHILYKHEETEYELKNCNDNELMSYHLHIKNLIEEAIKDNKVQKYHFTLMRNLYEKTTIFLGHKNWKDLLPKDDKSYNERIIGLLSHSDVDDDELALNDSKKRDTLEMLYKHLTTTYKFRSEE